jgi:hypothetical protein|nr:MAG TPA: minor capsid protein [Caudoviricetes sp.]
MRYPFTPELLDALPEELAELYRNLENTLLEEICSRLKASGELNEVTVLDIQALRSHGISQQEIEQAIKRTTNIGEKELNKLFDDVVERNQKYYTYLIDRSDVTAPKTLLSIEDTYAIYEQTRQTFRNITQSMAFLLDNGRTLLRPASAYQWALDNAVLQIQSGAISYNQAIRGAVKQLADSGIKTAEYESGHMDQIDVAVRRAIMTGINQLCQQYSEQGMDYLETDLVEVSAHIGARNTGTGPENHESWQGKIYRWSKKPKQSSGRYPDFIASTGYGTGPGLGGWNCRHHFYPFVESVMEPTYSSSDLNAMKGKNREISFEGRQYDGYTATQKQRQIERTVRKLKREQTAYNAAGLEEDYQAVTARIRRLNKEYKAFSEAAGLPLQRERMQIQYPEEITGIKQFSGLRAYQGDIKIVRKFSERQYQVQLDPPQISGVTDHFAKNLTMKPDRAALTIEASQSIINNSRLVLYQTDRNTLKFLADNGYVVLSVDGKIVTAVPEKLRKKYRGYLEGK